MNHIFALLSFSVFVICAYGKDVLYTMCAAENADLLNGQYVFISIDFAYMTKSNPENRPCSLIKDLEGKYEHCDTMDDSISLEDFAIKLLLLL